MGSGLKRGALLTFTLLAVSIAAAGCSPRTTPYIAASGTVEVVQTDIAALVPARITHLLQDEGDAVAAGDTLVRLTQSTLASDIELRRARVAAADAALRDLESGARPEEIGRAEAELRSAEAEATRASQDYERAAAMLRAQAISQSQLDLAKAAAATAESRRDAARESLKLLQAGTREARIVAARAEVNAARAALNASLAQSGDLVIVAPSSGTVLSRYAEVGEVIGAGVPLATIGDLQQPWVRVFVAAPALPRLRVGQDALAQLQGVDDQLFAGRIIAIDSRGQFTPRIALTPEERADLMFGVKVQLGQEASLLKPGLPIDVFFDTSGAGFPATLTNGKTVHTMRESGTPGG
jgi:HlyD family secretion protein